MSQKYQKANSHRSAFEGYFSASPRPVTFLSSRYNQGVPSLKGFLFLVLEPEECVTTAGVPTPYCEPMTEEERRQARVHWKALMFAPSIEQLTVARQALKMAPLCVQDAVLKAIATTWAEKRQPVEDKTPFD